MSRARLLFGIIIVAVLALAGYYGYQQYLAPVPATPTPTSGAASEPTTPDLVSAEGVVIPARDAALAFRLTARVAEVLVAEGDTVEAGQALVRLESDDLRAAAAQADAGVEQVLAAIAQAQAGVNLAAAGQVRAEAVVDEANAALALVRDAQPDEPTTASDAQLAQALARVAQADAGIDQAQAQAEAAEAALTAAQAGLEAAQAVAAAAQTQLNQATLSAPFAGTVVAVNVDLGELATLGAPVVVLADLSHWQVRTIDLAESDVALVAVGQTVSVTFDALPDVSLAGTVTEISEVAETSRGNVTYAVTVDVDAAGARLRWGMTAFVDIGVAP